MEIKRGDKVRVETNTGGGLYGKVIAVIEPNEKCPLTRYFVAKRETGEVSLHNEIDTGLYEWKDEPAYTELEAQKIKEQSDAFVSQNTVVIPETPSFKKGQIIKSGEEVWEVTEIFPEADELEITPLELSGHMSSYIEFGQKYRLFKHGRWGFGDGEGLWEIPPEVMNRTSSQVLLYLWADTGPSIEIDC